MSGRLPNHELRELARWAAADGWRWERLGSDHFRFVHPNTRHSVVASGTTRDLNSGRILRRQMRRALERSGRS